MSLLLPSTLSLRHRPHRCFSSSSASPASFSASLGSDVKIMTEANTAVLCFDETKDRIRKLFDRVQLSVSSYDTAWVAMVPSPNSSQAPCFPECIDWLLDNQLSDGSWGLPHHHPSLIKDVLSSTLASLLALKRWGVGEEQIRKGLHFIELNITSASDKSQHSPIGFDIIFPGMVEYAKDLNLNLPLGPTDRDAMLHRREFDLRRGYSEERKSYLAYVSEGMGKLQDWEMVMKYQRKNGSLFNSPSTTAAAFIHLQDTGCLNYLRSLLEKFGNAVPTVYPMDIYARLCMVDSLERLGIDRHFRREIKSVLDEIYGCWLQGEEEIFLDSATCAMAFRFLRLNGYDVSSDPLTQITRGEQEFSFSDGHLKDIAAALELYRASQIIIYPDESALEEQYSWSSNFLKQKLHNGTTPADRLVKYVNEEVNEALKFPFHAIIKRMETRRNIEHYNVDSTSILKTSFSSSNIRNEDFLKLAVEDFNTCQSVHCEELKYLERWVVDNRLDMLKFARQKIAYCYFSAAAITLFSPELSDARSSWAKHAYLTAVVDDFFDFEGSMEELENLLRLVEQWDVNGAVDCCSENVKILFYALHSTICETGEQASTFQGRCVTSHIIEIWLDVLNTMMREAKWSRDNSVPTLDEYMPNAFVSFAVGPIVLPALYFVGPKLSEEVVHSSEYQNLSTMTYACGRLLNDIQSFKRESKQGKLNAVGLYMLHGSGGGAVAEEEAIGEVKNLIANYRRELLRVVLQENGSLVPRPCKDLFWNMSQVLHLFYMNDDGFSLHGMLKHVKAIIHEPMPSSLAALAPGDDL